MRVKCYRLGEVEDHQLDFAVIISKFRDQYVFVRHQHRQTLEIPGGKREAGETIDTCAMRELREETGAVVFSLKPLFSYSVEKEKLCDYGQVFLAEIETFQKKLEYEIVERVFMQDTPQNWTYPKIQPYLFAHFLATFPSVNLYIPNI